MSRLAGDSRFAPLPPRFVSNLEELLWLFSAVTTFAPNEQVRKFGSGQEQLPQSITDLTRDSDRQLFDAFLQFATDAEPEKRKDQGHRGRLCARSFPIESYDKHVAAWSTCGMNWANLATTPNGVPAAAIDLRSTV